MRATKPLPENHCEIGGVPILRGGRAAAVGFCVNAIRAGRQTRIATANLDFLALARRDERLKRDLQESDMVVADGMPVVWLARLAGAGETQRVAGVDLVEEVCAEAGRAGGVRVALYGSSPEMLDGAARHLGSLAGVEICFRVSPPFRALSDEECQQFIGEIHASKPNLVLVALGCPAQERFIAEAAAGPSGPVWIGVGGTFDFYAGKRSRAPRMAQRAGMEWMVRMAQEPRRLGRRYLLRDLPALVRLAPGCVVAGVKSGRGARVTAQAGGGSSPDTEYPQGLN